LFFLQFLEGIPEGEIRIDPVEWRLQQHTILAKLIVRLFNVGCLELLCLLVQELQVGCAFILALAGGLLLFSLAPVPVRLFIIPLIVALIITVGSTLKLEIILQGLLAVLYVVS
jgi:hypothetical protein